MKAKSEFPFPIYLDAPVRSPIGKFGGTLKRLPAPALAALTLKECVKRALPAEAKADWVFLGHARQAGARPNPARQAAIAAGFPDSTPAFTVNQACASGLTAVVLAAEKIAVGKAKRIFAGGVESMSNTPYFLMDARFGQRLGHGTVVDGMHQDGFFCPMAGMVMGETVDRFIAAERKISREEQDAYALQSQQRAEAAWKAGKFATEIFEIPAEGKAPGLSVDEHRRGDTTAEALAKLKPVFDPKNGTITAGNSSGITDGAAFVAVNSTKSPASEAEILATETIALDPRYMGIGPVTAIGNLLSRQGLGVADIEAFEINEAFAAQVLACQKELRIPNERLNAWGGSIAIGHPIGASGARVLVTLLSRLAGKPGALGVASLCVSGGLGIAVLIRRL
ncbi:thiolase family protein [bacterium]|nr:thiolase family protein [bacterium]